MLLPLNEEENEDKYLGDILQMWIEGIEAEIPELTTQTDQEVHWTRFQLRKQLIAAQTIKMRIDTTERETPNDHD